MTLAEVSGQTSIECEFKDYLGASLTPQTISVRIHNDTQTTEAVVGTEQSDILYGRRASTYTPTFNAFAQIIDGVLTITFHTSSSDQRVTAIFPIEITSLETDEKVYTEFKFQ